MSFAADINEFCKSSAPSWIGNTLRKVVIECWNRADLRSPVGNPANWKNPHAAPPGYVGGTFRRNWQYGFGSVPSVFFNEVDPSGRKAGDAVKAGIMAADAVGVHYISNPTPYAERIENGWSTTQAPNGIVNLIELEFDDIVRIAQA